MTDRADVRSQGVSEDAAFSDGPARERFEQLYRGARDDVYAYAMTLLRDRAAAEDVTAVAFERALRRRRTFDRHRGEERAWLFGIARNAALDELRRRRRTAALVVDPVDVDARPGTRSRRGGQRIVARGHGAADPVAPNTVNGKDNPAGRARNRRVTIAFPRR